MLGNREFNKTLSISILVLQILTGCSAPKDGARLISELGSKADNGELSAVIALSDSIRQNVHNNVYLVAKADSIAQIAERIKLDFSVTEELVSNQLAKKLGSFSPSEKADWERKGWLEYRMIDGRKMYFNRAASNLVLIKKFHENKASGIMNEELTDEKNARLLHTSRAIQAQAPGNMPVLPVRMIIKYTITVDPDAVPAGETVRCWMPWPKAGEPRQKEPKLIETSAQPCIIAPDSAIHSTIYMEGTAKAGTPVTFSCTFSYTSYAQYFDMKKVSALPYDKNSMIYRKFTREELPHICFTDGIKHLADSIAGDEQDPAAIVRRIYMWFKENIPWSGAPEYSTVPNIPEYVRMNLRGDCGMQTLLFMSMLRYKGIPVRWQSGWMVPPNAENLHDWCEVYYEGTGWVPVDVSYDLQQTNDLAAREFYLSGIDAWRMIVNSGIAGRLYPEKLHLRSEPYDFQRGEVEWKGGNLYFDKWSYEIRIEYPD